MAAKKLITLENLKTFKQELDNILANKIDGVGKQAFITQAQYEEMHDAGTLDPDTYYIITDDSTYNDLLILINSKVEKVAGKDLSTNDFTNVYKSKLDGIASGAQVNTIESISVNGTSQTISSKNVDLHVATLDANGKVPTSQLPDSILGQLIYGGILCFVSTTEGQTGFNSDECVFGLNEDSCSILGLSMNHNPTTINGVSVTGSMGIYSYTDVKNAIASNLSNSKGLYFIVGGDIRKYVRSINSYTDVNNIYISVGSVVEQSITTGDWLITIGIDSDAINFQKIDNTDAVTGVKGNAESTYRTGNVNLTPANIGAIGTNDIDNDTLKIENDKLKVNKGKFINCVTFDSNSITLNEIMNTYGKNDCVFIIFNYNMGTTQQQNYSVCYMLNMSCNSAHTNFTFNITSMYDGKMYQGIYVAGTLTLNQVLSNNYLLEYVTKGTLSNYIYISSFFTSQKLSNTLGNKDYHYFIGYNTQGDEKLYAISISKVDSTHVDFIISSTVDNIRYAGKNVLSSFAFSDVMTSTYREDFLTETKASNVNSESATNGQILTANGSGGASWQNAGSSMEVVEINIDSQHVPQVYTDGYTNILTVDEYTKLLSNNAILKVNFLNSSSQLDACYILHKHSTSGSFVGYQDTICDSGNITSIIASIDTDGSTIECTVFMEGTEVIGTNDIDNNTLIISNSKLQVDKSKFVNCISLNITQVTIGDLKSTYGNDFSIVFQDTNSGAYYTIGLKYYMNTNYVELESLQGASRYYASGISDSSTISTMMNTSAYSKPYLTEVKESDVNSESATSGQVLTANGSGGASWQTPSVETKLYKHEITYSNYPTMKEYEFNDDGTISTRTWTPNYAAKSLTIISSKSTAFTTQDMQNAQHDILYAECAINLAGYNNVIVQKLSLLIGENYSTDSNKLYKQVMTFPSGTTITDTVTEL